ncbi:RagB/SusD family nutrient uptake outer membrane protein [Arthrospiribacter ruber]|uniref:RagB/SusD family nutrient uptake outer membrane protein n=1 Tax=Arthrospiribacter ruber TaxID=2487934 RepID=A0A951IVW4_9BACT|nr:RagB/SusD family nutrient uptake outer membrane protein [Arthrospiribacter ruber]MBW3467042.1 RagB/SusD family nutrient uptake outer membrane protein [Arthrospiribacter ruber]
MNKISSIIIIPVLLFSACMDVGEKVYDKYSASEFYATPEGTASALAGVYAQIPGNWGGVGYAGADNGWYDLNCMTTDEQVIPHRNTGDWQLDFARLHQRQWLPADGINANAWNWLYRSVFLANLAVEQLENAGAEPTSIAEARVLRAFFYYLLMDAYGNVPLYDSNDIPVNEIQQANRSDVFDFVSSELENYIEDLSTSKGGQYYGRFTRWAGHALLAKVYLNAEVYTGTAMWEKCLEQIEKLESGGFSLHPASNDPSHPLGNTYYNLFGDRCPDDETILAIYTQLDVVGRNILTVRSLRGADGNLLIGASAWNGSVVPQGYVEKFSDNDIRKRQFRFGNTPYGPRPAGFMVYELEISNLDNPGADPLAGARNIKFWPAAPVNSGGASNDFPIFRYADILLMKAECLIRTGNPQQAKTYVDQIRERAGLDALTENPTLEDVYEERGFELSWEGHRRQDMIRFGTFTQANGFIPAVDDTYLLFPIPTHALNTNPNLNQNPGW